VSTIGNDHVDLGAYALGLLEDQDKVTFEAHLATCDACRTELPSLSPIAGLLRGMDPVEVPGDVKLPVDLLSRRAAASRRGRRRLIIASAAACVVLAGGGIGVGLAVASGPAPATTTLTGQLHTATNAANGVTGTIGLAAKGWGTQVTLDLAGVHGPLECELIATSRQGQRRVVTGWLVTAPGDGVPGHPAHLLVQGGTAIGLARLASFEVIVVNGPTLLTIPV